MKRFPPHIVYMKLAAWRTCKTLLHCGELLCRILGETSQTDALSVEIHRCQPFWIFWLDHPSDAAFAEGLGSLVGAFFNLADHDNQTNALLVLTLAQDPLSREHIQMGMEYLALTDPVSTAISQQEEEEESLLLKWKPPQIVKGNDDDSLEAVVKFIKETNKREKE
ncbi:hypothetical protein HV056_23655 [Enterobacter asburiae]|uniref:Uncharacterized protein n=2 Tax=Enterobacter asburiae TaxID=61645 RepID=A0A7W3HG45_ENTAS|nr:hypothetical protein [Enterobacter asburiae]